MSQSNPLRVLVPLLMLALASVASGCAKPWNVAHAGLETGAEAVAQTDEMVATLMAPRLREAQAEIVAESRQARQQYEECTSAEPPRDDCGDPPNVPEYMARYDDRVRSWESVTRSLEVIREILLLAETAVTAWRDTKTQPNNWGPLCERLGEAQRSIVRAIEACEVEVPSAWEGVLGALEPVCTFLAPSPLSELIEMGGNE